MTGREFAFKWTVDAVRDFTPREMRDILNRLEANNESQSWQLLEYEVEIDRLKKELRETVAEARLTISELEREIVAYHAISGI